MAQASQGRKNRPLSPHLQIWRWGPAMAVSILHRVSGSGLSVVGLAVLLFWLGSLAGGADSYAQFLKCFDNPVGLFVLVGVSWAYFNHLCSGIRHFFLDIGAGFELDANNRWSILTPIIAILLTAAFWAAILLR